MQFMNEIAHRPYPLPEKSWAISQVWKDLLFAHWRVDANQLRQLVPPPLEIDRFDGCAWLGVVPFRMCNVKHKYAFEFGPISNFLELNVRTYVTYKGIRAVYFFSLDASNLVPVLLARNLYKLPYFLAEMKCTSQERDNDWIDYSSMRKGNGSGPVSLKAKYRPCSPAVKSEPGSLAEFLTERYCLLLVDRERVIKTDIHHAPWQLSLADAEITSNSMCLPLRIDINRTPDALHFSQSIEMVNWQPEIV